MKIFLSRRNFLKKTSKGLTSAMVIYAFINPSDLIRKAMGSTHVKAQDKNYIFNGTCAFGVEGSAPKEVQLLDEFLKACQDLGAEFIVCQFAPKNFNPAVKSQSETWCWYGTEKDFNDLANACRKHNMTYFANQEVTNYSKDGEILDENHNDVLAHADKTHRWDITGKLLLNSSKNPEFRGVLYDEAEHGQMRREVNTNGSNESSTDQIHPYFAVTDGMGLEQAYNAVYKSARKVAENYRKAGVTPMTEHVFPAMQFTFARAGFDIATKFMKEGMDPVYAAIAIGAAKQYGRDFCVSPDLWGWPNWVDPSGFPGHPTEELRASLLYAYWIGATRIFVENIRGLIERKSEFGEMKYQPTEYGKVFQWFVKEYVPSHPRQYTFRDIHPEVAILRLDDSCWGQSNSWLPDYLYGAVNLHTTPETAAWFQIWKLLTHGLTHEEGLSFHNNSYSNLKHDFFYPLKDVIVYDHLAGEKEMDGLKLVFLTGVRISPQTLNAVRAFVKKGGLCVSLTSLAPTEFKSKLGKISDGAGQWLFVKDFDLEEVRTAVSPFLGKPDEISYRIGKQRLTVKIGKNRNSISIYLQDEKDMKNNGQISEAGRIW